ncbi:YheT family hydrolase [Lunatibacter salilacus]|uniref:YheT family hydrolase n=1 Tax=Lunatibacter salilacus TaxID=2483804 RepID=UPI00131D70B5|nr:alpha/beta fold hydrolase [Lunatibacter salilacus]
MPVIKNQNYVHPFLMFNGHIQTIVPALLRTPCPLSFDRERITTPDGDFLDLDWLKSSSERLLIISHGLEGDSRRPYMVGMANYFFSNGWDVLSWNFRGCSGEMNRRPIFYHSGATDDLETVIAHAHSGYREICLIGFSLGGNLTLKYLGEDHPTKYKVKKAVAISVPLDLSGSSNQIGRRENSLYTKRFLKTLKEKILQKSRVFPKEIQIKTLSSIRSLRQFDDVYTGPLHGFEGAEDYYTRCSSINFLSKISARVLILNARNDPFLSSSCYPEVLGVQFPYIYMDFPENGGHVGFAPRNRKDVYWSEKRALEFLQSDY